MEEFLRKYRKLILKKKLLTRGYFVLMGLAFLIGLAGVIICGAKNSDSLLTFWILFGFAVPVVMWVMYLIFLVASKEKKRKMLDLELENSDLTVEDILQLGTELKIDLFGVAVNKRVKKLGIAHVPEWCVRDGVLPVEQDVNPGQKMNIKVSGFKSALSYNDSLKQITEKFIRDVGAQLGEKLVEAELDDYDCDLKLIFIQSGGSEGDFLANLETLREPYYLLTNGSNNSLAASLEIMTYCNLHGKKGEVIHGDIRYVADRIRTLATAEKLKRELKNTKFGVIGKPSDWLISSIPSYEAAEEKLGVTFENIPLEKVRQEFDKISIVDVNRLPQEFPNDEKIKSLKTYKAFKNIAELYALDGFTVRCFDLLKPLGTTGCIGLALLNDEGITSTCEGDISAMLSMHIATLLTGRGCFQANPSSISVKDNTIVFAHCTLPLSMAEKYELDTHFESGTGIAVKAYLKETDVTVLRISSDLKTYFVSDGRIIKNLNEKDLCRTQILVELKEDVSRILKRPCGNHHIIFYGHYAELLKEILEDVLW